MNKTSQKPRIIFLNQMAGPLFRELAEDISKQSLPSVLLTGHPDTLKAKPIDSLRIIAAPTYQRGSYASRVFSWVRYLFSVLFRCFGLPGDALLFVVSNPPILLIIGYLFRFLRQQQYVILIYDMFLEGLIQCGQLKTSGLIARLWRLINRLALENAEIVFAIGDTMAARLEHCFDAGKTRPGKVIAIPNWADTDWIRPIEKKTNQFAHKYDQVDKLTVMYSGNLGQRHDIETILQAAKKLREHDSIHFMIIGDGAKKTLVEKAKCHDNLDNMTVLPFQPEHVLPSSLPTAEIAIVTVEKGLENLMAPSKTYYAMAAGSALIGLCGNSTEVAHVINRHECGIVINPGDAEAFTDGITALFADRARLNRYRANSRRAAEKSYSRKNTLQYLNVLTETGLLEQ